MAVSLCGDDFHYLNPFNVQSYPDIILISAEKETFSTNRLVLSSVSPLFHSLFLEFEAKPVDDEIVVVTEFSSKQLQNIVAFITSGVIPVTSRKAMSEVVSHFSAFGIDLNQLNLWFPCEVEATWNEDDENFQPIKTELIDSQEKGRENKCRKRLHVDENCDEISDPTFEAELKSKRRRGKYKKRKLADEENFSGIKKFSCPYCQQKVGSLRYLRQHVAKHENEEKLDKWICIICNEDSACFETKEALEHHRLDFHVARTFSCPKCPRVFKGINYHRYKAHLGEHEQMDSKFVCVCCGYKAKSLDSLCKHKANYGPFHDGKCPTCQVEFESWNDYERHVIKDHSGNFLHKCGLCPKIFDTVQRMRLHRKEDHFVKGDISEDLKKRKNASCEQQVCEYCGKLVRCKYYDKHLVNNHGTGDYPCPQCGKVVNHPEVLERHIKNYHNEFPCEQCGKTMRNRKKYNIHILSFHTPEHLKPYQCTLCDPPKGFHTKTNWREHQNVHSNERPHKCKFCGVGFNSAGNRFAHERSSHLGIKRKK